ncbi:hypothetical protein DIPPA_12395 [Diplonema papillatum]|nr:hypothetical protein DIPPA_12395 [Diplonema papillatum]
MQRAGRGWIKLLASRCADFRKFENLPLLKIAAVAGVEDALEDFVAHKAFLEPRDLEKVLADIVAVRRGGGHVAFADEALDMLSSGLPARLNISLLTTLEEGKLHDRVLKRVANSKRKDVDKPTLLAYVSCLQKQGERHRDLILDVSRELLKGHRLGTVGEHLRLLRAWEIAGVTRKDLVNPLLHQLNGLLGGRGGRATPREKEALLHALSGILHRTKGSGPNQLLDAALAHCVDLAAGGGEAAADPSSCLARFAVVVGHPLASTELKRAVAAGFCALAGVVGGEGKGGGRHPSHAASALRGDEISRIAYAAAAFNEVNASREASKAVFSWLHRVLSVGGGYAAMSAKEAGIVFGSAARVGHMAIVEQMAKRVSELASPFRAPIAAPSAVLYFLATASKTPLRDQQPVLASRFADRLAETLASHPDTPGWTVRQIAAGIASCAALRCRHHPLFALLLPQIAQGNPVPDPAAFSRLAWGCAVLRLDPSGQFWAALAGGFAALFPAPAAAAPELLAVAAWGLLASGAQLPEPHTAVLLSGAAASLARIPFSYTFPLLAVGSSAGPAGAFRPLLDEIGGLLSSGADLSSQLSSCGSRSSAVASFEAIRLAFLEPESHTAPSFGPPPAPFKKVIEVPFLR